MKKIICMLAVAVAMIVMSNFPNIVEAAAVDTGQYIVYTESIKLNQGIYQVKIRYSNGKGTPMFVQFAKLTDGWNFRDGVVEGAWISVSGHKDMNDVLYVVLHSHDYE